MVTRPFIYIGFERKREKWQCKSVKYFNVYRRGGERISQCGGGSFLTGTKALFKAFFMSIVNRKGSILYLWHSLTKVNLNFKANFLSYKCLQKRSDISKLFFQCLYNFLAFYLIYKMLVFFWQNPRTRVKLVFIRK